MLPPDLRAAVAQQRWRRRHVLDAITIVRRQTKVDATTGAPERGSLRSTRVLCSGNRLTGGLRLHDRLTPREAALLASAVCSVRRIGLHRNRGPGAVRCRLLDDQGGDVTSVWARWLLGTKDLDQRPAGEPPSVPSTPMPPGQYVVTYRLILQAPALLSSVGNDAATVETLGFVSGASLLGAMVARWLRSHAAPDPAVDPAFRCLFLDGTVRWLHAYPEGGGERRLLPLPRSIVVDKTDEQRAFDLAGQEEPDPDVEWMAPRSMGFVGFNEDHTEIRGRAVALASRLHHQRDREAGRPTEANLFSYVAIDAGERFVGHVLCEDGEAATAVQELLAGGPVEVGRSRTATYGGRAAVEILHTDAADRWLEATPVTQGSEETPTRIVVTLLSDYLGRGSDGQPDPMALMKDLAPALGDGVRLLARFVAGRVVGGYVSKWRMPRPSHPALAAGSVLVFDAPEVNLAGITTLRWNGIGERCPEGFGRLAFHWHGTDAGALEARNESPYVQSPAAHDAASSPEFRRVEARLLRMEIQRALAQRAADEARLVRHKPPPALVSRLRARVRTAATALELVTFLHAADGKRAGRALDRARRGNKTWREWLLEVAGQANGGDPSWLPADLVVRLEQAGFHPRTIDAVEHWELLRTHLDTILEAMRRAAQAAARTGRGMA